MTVAKWTEAVRRPFFAEHWKRGTVERILGTFGPKAGTPRTTDFVKLDRLERGPALVANFGKCPELASGVRARLVSKINRVLGARHSFQNALFAPPITRCVSLRPQLVLCPVQARNLVPPVRLFGEVPVR
jgi:hypothetical protein